MWRCEMEEILQEILENPEAKFSSQSDNFQRQHSSVAVWPRYQNLFLSSNMFCGPLQFYISRGPFFALTDSPVLLDYTTLSMQLYSNNLVNVQQFR